MALEVLRILETENLVEASAVQGEKLRALVSDRLGGHPNVGDVRESPALDILELLTRQGATVGYTDPFVASLAPLILLLTSGQFYTPWSWLPRIVTQFTAGALACAAGSLRRRPIGSAS